MAKEFISRITKAAFVIGLAIVFCSAKQVPKIKTNKNRISNKSLSVIYQGNFKKYASILRTCRTTQSPNPTISNILQKNN